MENVDCSTTQYNSSSTQRPRFNVRFLVNWQVFLCHLSFNQCYMPSLPLTCALVPTNKWAQFHNLSSHLGLCFWLYTWPEQCSSSEFFDCNVNLLINNDFCNALTERLMLQIACKKYNIFKVIPFNWSEKENPNFRQASLKQHKRKVYFYSWKIIIRAERLTLVSLLRGHGFKFQLKDQWYWFRFLKVFADLLDKYLDVNLWQVIITSLNSHSNFSFPILLILNVIGYNSCC